MPHLDLLTRSGVKRRASILSLPRKKAKLHLDDLPWKTVARPITGLDGDDDVLGLEEVEDVEVIYEDTDAGRTVKFKVIDLVLQTPLPSIF